MLAQMSFSTAASLLLTRERNSAPSKKSSQLSPVLTCTLLRQLRYTIACSWYSRAGWMRGDQGALPVIISMMKVALPPLCMTENECIDALRLDGVGGLRTADLEATSSGEMRGATNVWLEEGEAEEEKESETSGVDGMGERTGAATSSCEQQRLPRLSRTMVRRSRRDISANRQAH